MEDAELLTMAGHAMGLSGNELLYFNPLQSDRQTMEMAARLKLNVVVDFHNNQTLVSRLDENGTSISMLVEEHSDHNGRVDLAIKYAVLRVAAAISVVEQPGANAPPELNFTNRSSPSPNKTPCFKHGRRVTPVRKVVAQEAVIETAGR